MTGVIQDFGAIFTRWRTWFLMANQDIYMRYRRSLLGPFWISIAMATLVFSIGLLYAEVQNQPFEEFLTFFGCGMLAWVLLSAMISEGCQSVIESEGQLRNLPLPMPVLAMRIVYRNFVILFHNVVVVGLMLAIFGRPFNEMALLALPGLLLYVPLGVFIGIALGPICARFRDLPQVVASVLQIMFFLTPIFWMPSGPIKRPVVIEGNPFYHLVEIVRAPLLGKMPTELNWAVCLAILFVSMLAAIVSLAASRKRVYLWL